MDKRKLSDVWFYFTIELEVPTDKNLVKCFKCKKEYRIYYVCVIVCACVCMCSSCSVQSGRY